MPKKSKISKESIEFITDLLNKGELLNKEIFKLAKEKYPEEKITYPLVCYYGRKLSSPKREKRANITYIENAADFLKRATVILGKLEADYDSTKEAVEVGRDDKKIYFVEPRKNARRELVGMARVIADFVKPASSEVMPKMAVDKQLNIGQMIMEIMPHILQKEKDVLAGERDS